MFKKFLILIITLVLLASLASGDIFIVSPVERQLSNAESVELGSMQPGETLEINISDSTGLAGDILWSSASVPEDSLPSGWTATEPAQGGKTLIVTIFVPKEAERNIYNFKVKLSNPGERVGDEYFNARVFVEKGLITPGIARNEPEQLIVVNNPVSYTLTLNNESIARHIVLVDSTLSADWFQPLEIELKPKEVKEVELILYPRVYGAKEFKFFVKSKLNDELIASFDRTLSIKPTLKGKYSAALYGFPFYPISLFPYYLINGFLSLLIP